MNINVFSLVNTIMLTRALFVAAELDIAELLFSSAKNVDELSHKTKTHASSLKRVLYLLELHNVFKKNSKGQYINTDFSETMRSSHPKTIRPYLLNDDETRWNSFGNLGYSVKTGNSAFSMLYKEKYFDYLEKHPSLSSKFDDGMALISNEEDDLIAQKIAFKGIVADVGGGKGQLLNKIKATHKDVEGIVFDLPGVIDRICDDQFLHKKIAGSFFEPLSFFADIFILKRIIHDWDDEHAIKILRNVSLAMNENSRLFLIDGILDESKNKQLLASIDIILLTIYEGRERTFFEISELLKKAGLKVMEVKPIDDLMCAIECVKIL